MSEYPSVLVVSENPVSEINGVGVALSFFFEGAPVDNMRVLFPPQVSAGINTPPAWRPYSHELSGWGAGGRRNQWLFRWGLRASWLEQFSRRWLLRKLGGWCPDVIYAHANSIKLIDFTCWASEILGVRAVIHIVDEPGNEKWPQRLKALAASDVQIMAISHQMAEEYGRRFGDPYPVIFRGTDSSPLTVDHGESSARVARYLGAIHNPSYLDSNFHPLQDVAAAIERLAQQGTDIHLELMGGGQMTRDNVQNGAWPPSTRYTPYLPPHLEKQTVAEASLLVLPLTFDPQGAKQQAMSFSAKLPVYLSSGAPVLIYGPAENATVKFCLEQGVARVVSSPDPEQLLEAVRDLVANPAAQCAKARADWDRVKEELSAPRIRERFWGVLRDAGKAPFPTPAETP